MDVPAVRIDDVLRNLRIAAVRLVSITTNGAEREIIEGMEGLIRTDAPYIALADTGAVKTATLEAHGYRLHSYDDRGRTFESLRLTGSPSAR